MRSARSRGRRESGAPDSRHRAERDASADAVNASRPPRPRPRRSTRNGPTRSHPPSTMATRSDAGAKSTSRKAPPGRSRFATSAMTARTTSGSRTLWIAIAEIVRSKGESSPRAHSAVVEVGDVEADPRAEALEIVAGAGEHGRREVVYDRAGAREHLERLSGEQSVSPADVEHGADVVAIDVEILEDRSQGDPPFAVVRDVAREPLLHVVLGVPVMMVVPHLGHRARLPQDGEVTTAPYAYRFIRRREANVRVQDKVVVVTGAASGIGRGMAERFVREGAAHGRRLGSRRGGDARRRGRAWAAGDPVRRQVMRLRSTR